MLLSIPLHHVTLFQTYQLVDLIRYLDTSNPACNEALQDIITGYSACVTHLLVHKYITISFSSISTSQPFSVSSISSKCGNPLETEHAYFIHLRSYDQGLLHFINAIIYVYHYLQSLCFRLLGMLTLDFRVVQDKVAEGPETILLFSALVCFIE